MIQSQRTSIFKLFLITACSFAITGGGYYIYTRYAQSAAQGNISDYQGARDKAEVLALFKENFYWLSANPEYDPEYMLDNRAPSKDNMRYFGQIQIKVLHDQDAFVGFVAYYKKTADEGFLNFVCVKPEMRGKRYAEQLIRYAENDLRRMGARRIKLLTRTINHRARALYTRMGYSVTSIDEIGGFIYFSKMI